MGAVAATLALSQCSPDKAGSQGAELVLDSLAHNSFFYASPSDTTLGGMAVSVKFIYPRNNPNLYRELLAFAFPNEIVEEFRDSITPRAVVDAYLKRHRDDFMLDVPRDSAEASQPDFQWELNLANRFDHQDANVASVALVQYIYTGGAHGYEGQALASFDKQTGRVIAEADIFAQGYEEPLAEIIKYRLRQEYKVATDEELEQEGFFNAAEIVPNGNFYLLKDELIYCFNAYEIAPYAMGRIEVRIPYEALRNIAREDGILAHYIH